MSRHPLRSMTGYAQASQPTAYGQLTLSLRGVNHRGLDLHFHLASDFAQFENEMRALLKQGINRGHIEIRGGVAAEDRTGGGLSIPALTEYVAAFRTAAARLDLNAQPDLNALLGLPGVVIRSTETRDLNADFQEYISSVLTSCIELFNACREREGAQLGEQLLNELSEVETATEAIRKLRASALPLLEQRMTERLQEILRSSVSESRIIEEAAILLDRSDIQEELTRLAVHSSELRRILEAGGAVGKQIDFLLQEMNRETNTTLAKSANAGETGLKITTFGLAIKANIERIREQALNLE